VGVDGTGGIEESNLGRCAYGFTPACGSKVGLRPGCETQGDLELKRQATSLGVPRSPSGVSLTRPAPWQALISGG
jgi:hypothetical protein